MNRIISAILMMGVICTVTLKTSGSILYRGRLVQQSNDVTQFDAGTSYTMTFRVYSVPQEGTAFYTLTTNSVPIRSDGGFEVLLDSKELDYAILQNGIRTLYVGLALEDRRELMPRRQILALPFVSTTSSADAPGFSPKFGSLSSASLNVANLNAGRLEVNGELKTFDHSDSLSVRIDLENMSSLDMRQSRITALGETKILAKGISDIVAGTKIAVAPADGIAYVYAESSRNVPKVSGITQFCRKGDSIVAPVTIPSSEKLAVRFTRFIGK